MKNNTSGSHRNEVVVIRLSNTDDDNHDISYQVSSREIRAFKHTGILVIVYVFVICMCVIVISLCTYFLILYIQITGATHSICYNLVNPIT